MAGRCTGLPAVVGAPLGQAEDGLPKCSPCLAQKEGAAAGLGEGRQRWSAGCGAPHRQSFLLSRGQERAWEGQFHILSCQFCFQHNHRWRGAPRTLHVSGSHLLYPLPWAWRDRDVGRVSAAGPIPGLELLVRLSEWSPGLRNCIGIS